MMDLNLIKKKLDGLQKNQSSKEKVDYSQVYFKPPIGKSVVRILPSAFNPSNPFSELKIYYGIGKKVMISPLNFGEKDPIAMFASKLREEYNKENYVLAKKLDPKVRVFVPVIVRGEEDQGVRLWQFGKNIYEELLSLAMDEEIGDYTSIVDGRDIKIDTVGPESTGTPYNKSSLRVAMTVSPLSENKEQVEKWLKEQPNPKELFKQYSFDEMKKALEEFLSPEDEESDDVFETIPSNQVSNKGFNDLPWEKSSDSSNNFSFDTNKAKQNKMEKIDELFNESK